MQAKLKKCVSLFSCFNCNWVLKDIVDFCIKHIQVVLIARLVCNYLSDYRAYGRAVGQAVSRWLPTATARVRVRAGMWGLWWTKWHWGRFSPSTSVSPANHSTNFSIFIITRGWHNRPTGGRSPEWIQLDSTAQYTKKKCRAYGENVRHIKYLFLFSLKPLSETLLCPINIWDTHRNALSSSCKIFELVLFE
jgi:hypothetical protein